jgi:hypothetical protein
MESRHPTQKPRSMKYLLLPLVLICLLPTALAGQNLQTPEELKDAHTFDPAFTHVVYFWLKDPQNTADRKAFETGLRTLFKASKYTRTNFLGTPPKATRDVVDDSFTYGMILTFDSAEAQQAYQSEAVHLVFIEQTKHLVKKFVVYDATGLNPGN